MKGEAKSLNEHMLIDNGTAHVRLLRRTALRATVFVVFECLMRARVTTATNVSVGRRMAGWRMVAWLLVGLVGL